MEEFIEATNTMLAEGEDRGVSGSLDAELHKLHTCQVSERHLDKGFICLFAYLFMQVRGL